MYVFEFILAALALVLVFVLLLARIIKGGPGRSSGGAVGGGAAATDEARMIQEIYQGFNKLEERVEHLETLLMDKDTKGE